MKKIVLILTIIFIAIGADFVIVKKNSPPKIPQAFSFKECEELGYPIMESYPRQCKTPDGKNFVEILPSKITYKNASTSMIVIDSPLPETTVDNSFVLTGKAYGGWYFEASFPVQVLDSNNQILFEGPAQAEGDWMTSAFVPFKAAISLPNTYSGKITMLIKNDNPSGLPENDASLSFSLTKEASPKSTNTVKLYYYNPNLDQGVGGVQCSVKGLVPVERTIVRTKTPIQDVIKLLLHGDITASERAQGITSEFPLQGLTLIAASLTQGELTLTFNDSLNKTVGGSCRTGILWNQINATAKQFPEVKNVRFMPEELFQP